MRAQGWFTELRALSPREGGLLKGFGFGRSSAADRAAGGLNLHTFPFCLAQGPATLASCSYNSDLRASTSTSER